MVQNRPEFKELLIRILRYWPLVVIGLALSVLLAWYHLASTPKMYEASALLLIKDQKESGEVSEEFILDEFGVRSRFKNLENEILVLTSLPLLEKVVEQLEIQYKYLAPEGFSTKDLYKKSPIQVLDWQVYDKDCGIDPMKSCGFKGIIRGDDRAGFTLEVKDTSLLGEWGKELRLPNGVLTLSKTQPILNNKVFNLDVSSIRGRALNIKKALEVEAVGKNSSTIRLKIKDISPARAFDILTQIVKFYNEMAIADRSQVYKNTIDLINDRIDLVTRELTSAESGMENYKKQFNMVEVGSEATMILNDLSTYNKEISDKDVQLEILESIEQLLVEERNSFTFVPTNLEINNLTLARQLESFNKLLGERDRMSSDLGPSHPDLQLVEKQIQNLRETVIFNIQSIKTDLARGQQANKDYKESLENRLRSLPSRERALIAMERQKTVKENLYLYLLQKREEAAVSLVVIDSPGRMVQQPAVRGPVSPIKAQILLIAVFLGLALPIGFIILAETLNNKIRTEEEVRSLTKAPLIGSIAQTKLKSRMLVAENRVTYADEMFKTLRSNLAYVLPGKGLHKLLITSGMPGEGKSFISLNLGMTQAIADKKVIVIDLDLRKNENILADNESTSNIGVVNFLIDSSLGVDDVIQNSGHHQNFDVIKSGPKPPNPGEIILSDRLDDLFSELEKRYDFIILDSPPVGLVADPLEISRFADATMFVVRGGVTGRAQLEFVNELIAKKKLPNVFIIFNGLRLGRLYNYGTRYEFVNYAYAAKTKQTKLKIRELLQKVKGISILLKEKIAMLRLGHSKWF